MIKFDHCLTLLQDIISKFSSKKISLYDDLVVVRKSISGSKVIVDFIYESEDIVPTKGTDDLFFEKMRVLDIIMELNHCVDIMIEALADLDKCEQAQQQVDS
ncbi:hypothetical protein [Vagococcus acidifermentans]|uniref:Uncharacterized protein n=1 Tax=Vagococcus acidifermentans TaxID=564710 RepID=A0A430AMW6_9ENTE|nr:hypothetical protein [Vagococcus acidifermentans]RSU09500.1 hypothetical protein CBF27_12375 [Vagococcus acidifermentans]